MARRHDLTSGEIALLIDALTDDVALVRVLIDLGIRANPPQPDRPPSASDLDRAFEVLARLSELGLIRVGRVEYVDAGPPGRVAPVKHVAEPLEIVRERVDAAITDGDWDYSCWVVNTDEGDRAARRGEA